MLTRGMAQQLAEAIWNADVESPIDRVVLVHDTRYSEVSLEKFRERLWAVLVEGGVDAEIGFESTPLGGTTASAEPPSEATPPPTASGPPLPPAPAPPTAPAPEAPAPARKAFAAPVPTKKRLGGERGTRAAE
jgi:hypothetical protein